MLKQEVIDVLNNQINAELYSSNIYLQMSNWCRVRGLLGAAAFMKGHAEEEYQHMQRIWNYLDSVGVRPTLGRIEAVDLKVESLKDLLEQAYEHEKLVTSLIHKCVDVAQTHKDYKTFNFLQWFVDEQIEEEELFSGVLDKFTIAGEDGESVYYIDRDIANLH